MTKEEQDDILKAAWERKIKENHDMPSDLADTYSKWVRSKVQQGQQLITQPINGAEPQQQSTGGKEQNKPAPTK
jgi:hypothetical protein